MTTETTTFTPSPERAALLPAAERRALGKRLRDTVSRGSHADWSPPPARRDPVEILIETGKGRIPALLPIRYGRMSADAFAFLRGAAAIMAADLATIPATGLLVQAGGDSHLMNFGSFLSPEGNAVFDINDFDETLRAPFEWDVKRLAASIATAGASRGLSDKASQSAACGAVRAYREAMGRFAVLDPLAVWHTRIDLTREVERIDDAKVRARVQARIKAALEGTGADQGYPALTEDGRIADHPPQIRHFATDRDGPDSVRPEPLFEAYRATLPAERAALYDRFALKDTALKVVGVGSVGTFCAVGLFMTPDGAPLFLQVKEAGTSVLEPYAGRSTAASPGERIVTGQRLMQSTPDIFLGWTHDAARGETNDAARGRHFYVRQLKSKKIAEAADLIESHALPFHADLCGRTLARAHARTGDAAAIAGYLGSGDSFDAAVSSFALAYARQSVADRRALLAAIKDGRIKAESDTPRW